MIRYFIALQLAFAVPIASPKDLQDIYFYTSYLPNIDDYYYGDTDATHIWIDAKFVDTIKMLVAGSHGGVYFFGCEDNPDLYCIESGMIDLAIPRRKNKWPKSWETDFALFNNLGKRELQLFGYKFDTYVISSKSKFLDDEIVKDRSIYFYSVNDGLIAFIKYYGDVNSFAYYMLSGKNGLRLDLLNTKLEEMGNTGDD